MQTKRMARLIFRWMLILLTAAFGVGASASVFVKRWDPEFNTTFSGMVGTDVGWSGEAFISIADDCLTPAGTSLVGGSACSEATLDQGTLRFYDMSTGLDLLNLSWNKTDPGFDANIVAVRSDGVDPTGVLSLPAIEFDNKSIAGKTVDIDLYFVFFPEWISSYSGPLLSLSLETCKKSWGGYDKCYEQRFWSSIKAGDPTTPTTTPWTRVPEPGSLALVGLALAIGGWMRRRPGAAKQG